ncbi:conserved Plasmodium protein, unknown function [Plasmodium malariae]|uniref:Uncharacterized protein n=1 Tax=Plasmodium malariae TaxID=5858 RepID=A0A1C3L1V0_PLAMA|nr:conserved Plasmodium protein, unknown function [Plasmodium malariae]
MLRTYKCPACLTLLTRNCRLSTTQSKLSNEHLKKIKEFRKTTNLSISICRSILSNNNYDIGKSVNYIFQNLNENYENKKKKLTEGYYCLSSEGNLIGITELNSFNDLISENIYFKELLINLCNGLMNDNINRKTNYLNIDNQKISHYMHLFYKNNKIYIDKKLENIEDINTFKQIYFNRSINQLIKYTSYILNDYIFLRKYFILNLDYLNQLDHLDNLKDITINAYIIKKRYHHKEVRIDNFILCKGFSFAFLLIKSSEKLTDESILILEKLASIICINMLIYKSKHCSKSNLNKFDIHNCFQHNFCNSSINNLGIKEKKKMDIKHKEQIRLTNSNKENSEGTKGCNEDCDDFLQKKVQSICLLSDYLEKLGHQKLKSICTDNTTFLKLITVLEQELKIKIYTNMMYSMLNEDIVIL